MPRCCGNCALVRYHDTIGYSCKKRGVEISQDEVLSKRADDCPLVEIEPLTDSEKRIFLAAIMREHDICAKLDNDKVDDDTVKKLIPIVSNIKRKVKKALWG